MIKPKFYNKDILYLDNASTTIPYSCDLPENIWFNASAPYKGGVEAKNILNKCKADILKIFNMQEDGEILFTSGATESNNIIIKSLIMSIFEDMTYNKYSTAYDEYNIVVSPTEHPSVLNIYKEISDKGIINVRFLPVDENGNVIVDNLKNIIDNYTLLVSCMYVNNEVGNIQPIEELGKLCNDTNTLFHVDATQAVGKIEIDCIGKYIDYLTFSAHKFHGPKGIGAIICNGKDKYNFLYPLIYGGHQQNSKRSGTENVADIYLMTELLKKYISKEYIQKSQSISNFINKQIERFLNKYFNSTEFKINSTDKIIPIFNISFKNITGEYLVQELSKNNIYISSGSACNTGLFENSHVLEAMKVNEDFIEGTIRISFDIEDESLTVANIKKVIKKIKEIIYN